MKSVFNLNQELAVIFVKLHYHAFGLADPSPAAQDDRAMLLACFHCFILKLVPMGSSPQ